MTAAYDSRELPVLHVRRWAEAGGLHAIVDACGAPSVPERAREMGSERAVSLYKGRAEEELWSIAPHLFALDVVTFDWIAAELWGTPWGFLLLADEPLDALRQHFRRFLTVKTPAGDQWYFRFYDPRVLRKYLETSTADEQRDFFGPAKAVAITNPDTYGVTVLRLQESPAAGRPRRPKVVVR